MKRRFNQRLVLRLAGLAAGVGLFYAVPWMFLRTALRDVLAALMRSAGYPVSLMTFDGSPALRVTGHQIHFTPDCTYMDLALILIPFLWRWELSSARNLCRAVAFILAVQVINLARLAFCTWMTARGADWFYVHELPDYLLYYPTLLIVVVAGLRQDWRHREQGAQGATTPADAPRTPC